LSFIWAWRGPRLGHGLLPVLITKASKSTTTTKTRHGVLTQTKKVQMRFEKAPLAEEAALVLSTLLGLFGAVFIFLTWALHREMRHFAFSIIMNIAICNIVSSIGYMTAAVEGTTSNCIFQAVLMSFGDTGAVLWSSIYALALYLGVAHGVRISGRVNYIAIGVYGMAFSITVAAWGADHFEPAGPCSTGASCLSRGSVPWPRMGCNTRTSCLRPRRRGPFTGSMCS